MVAGAETRRRSTKPRGLVRTTTSPNPWIWSISKKTFRKRAVLFPKVHNTGSFAANTAEPSILGDSLYAEKSESAERS